MHEISHNVPKNCRSGCSAIQALHIWASRGINKETFRPPATNHPSRSFSKQHILIYSNGCIRKGVRGRSCQQWILPQPEATNCRVVNLLSEAITVPRNATGCWVAMAAVHSNYFSCLNKPQVPSDCINKSQMRTGTSFKVLLCIHSQLSLGLSFHFSANICFSLPSIWSISLFGFPHRHLSCFCRKSPNQQCSFSIFV